MDWKIILYILLFAAAAALLYLWGLARSRDQQKTLNAMLYGKCEKRVRNQLKKQGQITQKEAEKLVNGVSVKLFYSKNRLAVTDPAAFSKALLERMEKTNIITLSPDKTSYYPTKNG